MEPSKSSQTGPTSRQKFYFQFITVPSADTPGTALLLHFDNRRYLLGRISEGTQRACIQRGVGIRKVRNLFVTGPTRWENMGGIIGMVLTMADVQADEIDEQTGKRPALKLHGGPKLVHSIACARRFVFRTGMPLRIYEADANDTSLLNTPSFSDDNIDVWSIVIGRRGRGGSCSPRLPQGRSESPSTVGKEQDVRKETVQNMFDSDWRKDRLVESRFGDIRLPALIWTRDPQTKELKHTQCSSMADAPELDPDSKVLVRNPWPASLLDELPPADNFAGSVSTSYIIKGRPQRGKFMPQKAKALGLPSGPDFAALAAGNTLTLKDGRVITPEMVLGETEPGRGMALFDVPSDEYLEDLSEKINQIKDTTMQGIECVTWILGKGVFYDPVFTQVVESLPGVNHIISSPDTSPNCLSLESPAASSIRLSQLRPECFVFPVFSNDLIQSNSEVPSIKYTTAERGLIVAAAPKFSLSRSEVPPLLNVDQVKALYQDILRPLLPSETELHESRGEYDDVQILTLGTGSAVPSKYRNVSATLVRIPHVGSFLFDCGENTLGMLRRAFQPFELDGILADLRMIWISHLHADHHLGTLNIIQAKKEAMDRLEKSEPQLHVVSEPNMADYLIDFDSVQSSSHCKLLSILSSEITAKSGPSSGSTIDISETSLPIKEFLTTKVSHCHGAQACSITFSNGFKFSYSGDCRPSAQFAKIGLNSDVLLHEATFDDGMEGDAMAKKHSTTAEALGVAQAMQAKNVVLTHFSQRYQKLPVLNGLKFGEIRFEEGDDIEEPGPIEDNETTQMLDPASQSSKDVDTSMTPSQDPELSSMARFQKAAQEMNVCVAFDLMSVTVGQIRDMYKYYPAIEKMFELQQEKSDAIRGERREEMEKLMAQRNKLINKTKTEKVENSEEISMNERINRNKAKGKKSTNDNTVQSGSDIPVTQAGGTSVKTGEEEAAAPMSNKAKKRALRQSQREQAKQATTTNSSEVESHLLRPPSTATRTAGQLSPAGEMRDHKRAKVEGVTDLDDGNTHTGVGEKELKQD